MTGAVKIHGVVLLCYAHDLGAPNPPPTLVIEDISRLAYDHIEKVNASHLLRDETRVPLASHRPQHKREAFSLALVKPRNRLGVWLAAYVQRAVYINSDDARWRQVSVSPQALALSV